MTGARRAVLFAMAWLALALGLVGGCGQMGPLVLPDDAASDEDDEDQSERENER